MNARRFWILSIAAAGAWWGGAVRAESVLYNDAAVVQGEEAFVQTFNVASAGTITFSLSNIPWLDTVSDLTGFLSTSSGAVGRTLAGTGSETISVGPGTYYAHWFGDAQGAYNEGVLGVQIQFQPNAITAVPIPLPLILLLSGLGLLFGWLRRPSAAAAG
jgi:hypothetical protein